MTIPAKYGDRLWLINSPKAPLRICRGYADQPLVVEQHQALHNLGVNISKFISFTLYVLKCDVVSP